MIGFVLFFAWLGFGGDYVWALSNGHHPFPWLGILLTGVAVVTAWYAYKTGPEKVLWATGAHELIDPQTDASEQASLRQRHRARELVDGDRPLDGEQKRRDPEKDHVHERKVPERRGGTGESALAQRFDDRHGDESERQRDAQAEKSREARALPDEQEFARVVRGGAKAEAAADRLEIRWLALHRDGDES